jgi:hypothetical protein
MLGKPLEMANLMSGNRRSPAMAKESATLASLGKFSSEALNPLTFAQ